MIVTQMLVNFVMKVLALIILSTGVYFAIELRDKLKGLRLTWILISVGVLFLQVYALSDVAEFGACLIFGDGEVADAVTESMDLLEMALVAAAASFLTTAGIVLKNPENRPT
ncbi:MAG: hypothetical protein JW778_03925 [Candidatus Altiarchaeota archaeon]|nr:hypothetical protein [Candidatus Altiarchaeota archaeon]